MHRFILGTAALALAGLVQFAASPARAEIEYPYCGYAREGAGGCTFATIDQCRAFVNGAGGSCTANPRYTANAGSRPRSRR